MEIGPVRVISVLDGMFALDGGAMFGVVPQPAWKRTDPPDDANRIRLALRNLVLLVDDRRILVDTGIGDKWSAEDRERFSIDRSRGGLFAALALHGLNRADITDVVLTHLHFDHAGGTTVRRADGTLELAFPNARHFVQRRNFAHARRPTARDRGSYLGENFDMLAADARLVLLDGPQEIAPGVDMIVFEGHTVGQQLVRVRDPMPHGRWMLYAADIIPTSSHLPPAFVMGYDLMPDVTTREKARVITHAAREEGILAFEHDPRMAACTIEFDDRRRPKVKEAIAELE